MTDLPATPGDHALTLDFKGTPIRVHMHEGVPHFALADLCEALGRDHHAAARVANPRFPAHAKLTCLEETGDGAFQDITMLTPVGVYFLTDLIDPVGGQKLAAWSRREAKRLCPDPRDNDPAMFLTLMPDRTLPPRPGKYSGRLSEWLNLRGKGNYLFRPSIGSLVRERMGLQPPAVSNIAAV